MDTESRFFFNDELSADSDETVIAEGGTAINYKVKIDGKWYSKKQLKAEYKDNPLYRDSLKKEFELGASLNNDFIVRYKDMGEDEKGPYLLTEFVEGYNLSEFITLNPDYFKSKSARKQFVDEFLSAVGCMHQHQMLHLDLKPDNIIITRIGHHVKLIDCGFAYIRIVIFILQEEQKATQLQNNLPTNMLSELIAIYMRLEIYLRNTA